MTRRPVKVVHSRANSAMVWLLPAPAGATSTVVAAVAVSIITTASRCSAFSPVRPTAARACSSADELRAQFASRREDLFLGVEVGQGAVPLLVRRPVDAAAVGGADAEAGHVGDVGAVTWTTSVPDRPQTASLATSSTTAGPSVPASRTGSARCTSNRS